MKNKLLKIEKGVTINGKRHNVGKFAYDGCHKIYLIEDESDLKNAKELDYNILPIEELKRIYDESCELKFIDTWKLEQIVEQFKSAKIEY